MTDSKFVVVEGNIGVGKTSLASLLSEKWNSQLLLEEFEENEYLTDFYTDQFNEQFQTELRFLIDRYRQLEKHLNQGKAVVSDYFIEKSLIFAEMNLSARDFKLYRDVFYLLFDKIRKPDLYIFLSADVEKVQQNIIKRGRKMERTIKKEYLHEINKGYLKYVAAHPELRVLTIDVSRYDFVQYPIHFKEIESLIQKELSATSTP